MAKRKKQSKAQKRKAATARPKARKVSKAARGKATKRTVAKAKPKPSAIKKAAPKQPVAPAVETLVDTTEIREESEPKPPSLI
jgi:3-oxoacyl-[acyl-carrier-protein] synthase III